MRPKPNPLENGIVWVEDPRQFDYVREANSHASSRHVFPAKKWAEKGRRVIAYATLHPAAPIWSNVTRTFERRFWYIDPFDRNGPTPARAYETRGFPSEAVDPLTIGVNGEEGVKSCRTWCGTTRFEPDHTCEHPTIDVDGWEPVLYAERHVRGRTAVLTGRCPLCGKEHTHGLGADSDAPLGAGDGHRVPHCTTRRSDLPDYVVREVRWSWIDTALRKLATSRSNRLTLDVIKYRCHLSTAGARIVRDAYLAGRAS